MASYFKKAVFFLPSFLLLAFVMEAVPFVQAAPPSVTTVLFLTSTATSTFIVPEAWTSNNTIEVIAGGGAGSSGQRGGGGGGYSAVTNLSLTPLATLTYKAGNGGSRTDSTASNGGDTWFNAASSPACTSATICVKAKGGGGFTGSSNGSGGASSGGVGSATAKFSGGTATGGGGGGAAGPNGNGGGSGSSARGGGGANGGAASVNGGGNTQYGGNNRFGTGGGTPGNPGTNGGGGGGGTAGGSGASGSTEVIWTQTSNGATAGPGAGGGGGADRGSPGGNSGNGAAGGSYGAGGGAGAGGGSCGADCGDWGAGTGADGRQGIVIVTYTAPLTVSITAQNSCIGSPGSFVIYRNGPTTQPLDVQFTLSGTAVAGVDYTPVTTSVTIPAGSSTYTVNVNPIAKYTGGNTTLTATLVPNAANYNVGIPATLTVDNNIAPTTAASVSGYTPAAFASYPLPITSSPLSGNGGGDAQAVTYYPQPLQPYPLLSNATTTWYAGTPSPITCGLASQGTCLYFATTPQGTRTAALTVAPQVGALPSVSAGVDIVATNSTNACGAAITKWTWVAPTAATVLVPKYSPVQISYACQPNQEYMWSTFRIYFSGASASTLDQRIFRFADRSKVNGTATSSLRGMQTQSVSTNTTFTLECGGYMPETGSTVGGRPTWPPSTGGDWSAWTGLLVGGFALTGGVDDYNNLDIDSHHPFNQAQNFVPTTVGLPPFYDKGFFQAGTNLGWVYNYWPWTWAFYNATSSSYYQPPASVTVQACSGDDEVVSGGVCTPCNTITPGSYRSGNSCIATPPPTATIQANGAGYNAGTKTGTSISVAPGTPVTVAATYAGGGGGSIPANSVQLTINYTKVAAALTNFPVYVNLANMPAAFWSGVRSDCGDIRVFASDTTTELPRELVACDSTAKTGEIWFKAPTLSNTVNSVFYIKYGSGAADYAANATYGAQNVWDSNYKAVWHLKNGTTLSASDSTVNAANGTINSAAATAGQLDGAASFNGSSASITRTASPNTAVTNWTLEAWMKPSNLSQLGMTIYNGIDSGGYGFGIGNGAGSAGTKLQGLFGGVAWFDSGYTFPSANTWYSIAMTRDTTTSRFYVNGAVQTNTSASTPAAVAAKFNVGDQLDSSNNPYRYLNGAVDEVRVSATPRAAAWLSTEYNNQSSPTTFYTVLPDTLAATAINDDATGVSVPCANIVPLNNPGCETMPDATKTFTLPASVINTPGTYTYSAQIKTGQYTTYNSYATVQVLVCPVGQGTDGSGGCQALDLCQNGAFPNNQSVMPSGAHSTGSNTCACDTSGYIYDLATNACVAPPPPPVPTLSQSSFTATRVRVGQKSTLSWNISGMADGITCSISPIPYSGTETDGKLDWAAAGSPATYTGTALTTAIAQPTRYTLSCTNGQGPAATRSITVQIIPTVQEI